MILVNKTHSFLSWIINSFPDEDIKLKWAAQVCAAGEWFSLEQSSEFSEECFWLPYYLPKKSSNSEMKEKGTWEEIKGYKDN